MKKRLIFCTAAVLLLSLFCLLPVAAEAETAEPSAAERLADFLLPHLSDIAVALAALWLAFPKWGGVAVVTKLLRRIHTYFDDANNSRSVYNLLAANADAVSRFMNDAAPLLADLREGREALKQAEAALIESEALTAEQKELLTAAHDTLALFAAELWRVVAELPSTDEATRARFAALAQEAGHDGEKTDVAV